MMDFEFDDIKAKIDQDYNATYDQRDKANEAIRFCDVPGGMWEDWQPRNPINRTRIEFNLVSKAVKRANGEWVSNRFRVKYRPDNEKASEENARILNGLYRRDERRSGGFEAYDVAIDETFKCGVGAWGLRTRLADDSDLESDDQNIELYPIPAAYNSVVWDHNAKRYDKADARSCTVFEYFTPEAYKERWPDEPISSYPKQLNRQSFNWFSPKQLIVAKHYKIVEKDVDQILFRNVIGEEKQVWADEIKPIIDELSDEGFDEVARKKRKKRTVWLSVMNGVDFIEKPARIAGTLIPIVPVWGYRSWIDGHEWFRGLVQELMDPNRLINSVMSGFAESAMTSIKSVPIFTQNQVKGLENYLAEAHTANYPYVVLNGTIDPATGQEMPLTQPPVLAPPIVDPNSSMVLDSSTAFINQETGGAPQDVSDPNASGKAINAIMQRVDMQTAVIFDNIQKSMRRCGEIYRSMSREVHDTTRYMMLVEEDGAESSVLLQDYRIDRETGSPVQINDISKGEYEVTVDTGPAYASKRQENVTVLRDIYVSMADGDPLKPLVMMSTIGNLDVDGIEDIQKFARRQLLTSGVKDPELRRYSVLFIIELKTRRVTIAGIHNQPNGEWMEQMARNLTDVSDGFLRSARHLIHDRDPLFTRAFGEIRPPSSLLRI